MKHVILYALMLVCAAFLAACGPAKDSPAVPVEISADTSCVLDGMLLVDFPGPKAQIHYEGQANPDFFCDTVEMFAIYLKPEQQRPVKAVYVQDMGKAAWEHPAGNWIDARQAYYVLGSKARGSMGATIASFAAEAAAKSFAAEHGGKVLPFAEVKPDMAALDGGALHDQKM